MIQRSRRDGSRSLVQMPLSLTVRLMSLLIKIWFPSSLEKSSMVLFPMMSGRRSGQCLPWRMSLLRPSLSFEVSTCRSMQIDDKAMPRC